MEPASSAVLSTGVAGVHKIQCIGAGFVPDVLDTGIYDEIIAVSNEDAFAIGKLVGKSEGVLVGISSGAAVWAPSNWQNTLKTKARPLLPCCLIQGTDICLHRFLKSKEDSDASSWGIGDFWVGGAKKNQAKP